MTDASSFGLKEAFEVYSKHRDVVVQMWSFYSAGTLAVLGYTIGSDKATRGWPEVAALLVGYVAFAVGNAWAVVSSQRELRRMADGILVLLQSKPLEPHFVVSPIDADHFILFYVAVTTVVCIAIAVKYKYGAGGRATLGHVKRQAQGDRRNADGPDPADSDGPLHPFPSSRKTPRRARGQSDGGLPQLRRGI